MCGEILWDYPNLQFPIKLSPVTAFTIHWRFCNAIRPFVFSGWPARVLLSLPRLIYLLTQFLYQYGLMDSHFTQLVITHCHTYFDNQLLPIWPVGAHQADPLTLLIIWPLSPSFWIKDFFMFFTARDIRTGFASGYTQLGYESYGAAVGQRGEKWHRRSELKATVKSVKTTHCTPASLPWAGPNSVTILRQTRSTYPGKLQGGDRSLFPSAPNYFSHFTCS